MRFASLDHFGLSPWRLACVGVAVGSGAWMVCEVVFGDALGGAESEILIVIFGTVFYIVVSVPKRALERQKVEESREAVLLSTSAKASLSVTGSRPKTLISTMSRHAAISRSLTAAARRVLLGYRVEDALALASEGLATYSAAATLRSIATLLPEGFESGDEESRGLEASGELLRETRLPVFMTVCFFAPIMMILYAVFTRSYGAVRVSELTVFEFMVVDLAFYLSSMQRAKA